MKTTKGQWQVYNAIPDSTNNVAIKSDNVLAIGVSNSGIMTTIALCGRKDNSEVMANAKLIAAAPDLLEVCQDFNDIIDGEYDDPVIEPKLLYRLREAIKKATE